MSVSAKKLATNARWDKAHMRSYGVKVRTELLEAFRAACKSRGDKPNTILRSAMEKYITESKQT